MAQRGICETCGQPVQSFESAAFRAVGFVVERSAGGANQLRHGEREPDRIWHARCVDEWVRMRSGRGVQQERREWIATLSCGSTTTR